MGNVIVFGSLNMDLTIEADRIPLQGETMAGRNFFTNPGGKGANQAVAAAKFGAPTYLIGAVGTDVFGDQIVSQLAGYGVHCDEVVRTADAPTGVAVITRVDGDNRIILDAGANVALGIEDVDAALDRRAKAGDVFLTQLECDHETTFAAIKSAHERGMYVVVNVAPPRDLPDDVWGYIDLVCVNETECEAVTGIMPADDETLAAALAGLADKGVASPVITLGGRGSAAGVGGAVHAVPATKVDACDTTAAGDTFIGVLSAAHVAGMTLEKGMAWASVAAGITASRVGAQQAIPVATEVDEFLRRSQGR